MLITESNSESKSHSVLSNSLQPHERYSPWNSPGQNTGVGNCSLLQENIPTQGSNPGLPHCRCILYQLSHKEAQDKKQRGTKEPLDESERGEWKGWLLTQHSENYDHGIWSHQFSSVQSLSICDPMNHSTPGFPVHHQLPEFTQTHVHRVGDAIQPSHPLSSPSPPVPNPSQLVPSLHGK